jgi:hypothetical protein
MEAWMRLPALTNDDAIGWVPEGAKTSSSDIALGSELVCLEHVGLLIRRMNVRNRDTFQEVNIDKVVT